MPELTARARPVREARQLTVAKFRRARGQFLAEGPQAVRAAIDVGAAVEVFVQQGARQDPVADVAATAEGAGLPVHVVDAAAFGGLVTARTPQGIVAVCTWATTTLTDLVDRGAANAPTPTRQVVLAHEMSDPGNAGALIRVADAAGAGGVALSARSVEATNPKSVRASAGSLFHLPVVAAGDTMGALRLLRDAGYRLLAADVGPESVDLFVAERAGLLLAPVAWVFGNEAHGLPQPVLAAVDHVIRIPILGRAESLNLATAAAVCLYAVARQQGA